MCATHRRGVSALALGVAVVLIGACTASGQRASPPTPTTVATMDAASYSATYSAAVAQVQAYLDMWVKNGPFVAAARYLVPEEQAPACASAHWPPASGDQCQAPLLLSAKVDSSQLASWTSFDNFMLDVTMSLHFSEDPTLTSNWGEGKNNRFFRFTRPDASSGYRMYEATSP